MLHAFLYYIEFERGEQTRYKRGINMTPVCSWIEGNHVMSVNVNHNLYLNMLRKLHALYLVSTRSRLDLEQQSRMRSCPVPVTETWLYQRSHFQHIFS